MGTMTGTNLITRANDVLQDKTNVRWTEAELLRWLNDGQREIVVLRPDASAVSVPFQLVANATKQALPAAGIRFLDMPRNLTGANGINPGRPITLVSRAALDDHAPDWHVTPTRAVIENYCFDVKVPKVFWVYPRPNAALWVELQYSISPADLASAAAAITLDDIFANALIDYMLYRAFSKDSEYANANAAAGYYGTFQSALGIRTQSDLAVNPNQRLGKGTTV